jgi:hypothetical protein
MSTTILRNSTVPSTFKYKVEAANLSIEVRNPQTKQIEQYPLQVGLVEEPNSHSIPAVDFFNILLITSAAIMSTEKFKNKDKSALVFNKSDNGEIIAACISSYDKEGDNYYYSFSFDPEEIKAVKEKVNFTDFKTENNMTFSQVFNYIYLRYHNLGISDVNVVNSMTILAIDTIYMWLDSNAQPGEIVSLTFDEVTEPFSLCTAAEYNEKLKPIATANVEVVKDVKKMNILFTEELRTIAKGSSDIIS